jgi:O-methyltransferase
MIMILSITLNLFQIVTILLVLIFLFLAFKIFEQKWSYKISKPYNWDEAVRKGSVSNTLKKIEKGYHDKVRFYTIWLQIERIKDKKIPGSFAELGVYQGETAKIIHELDPDRDLYLFDTFNGFSEEDISAEKSKEAKYSSTNFSDTDLEVVKNYIDGNEHIKFYPGYFPDSAANLDETTFSFVHLDADLYKPTIAALNYFYPKLSPGAVMIIHDYNHSWDGVREAIDEFSQTIPESFVAIADWQGSAMIVKNSSL